MSQDYQSTNRDAWNKRVSVHLESDFYDLKGWKAGKNSLNDIELDLLGNVSGKSILHLQCHFGQDSLSLARMGADVVGADLSDEAIKTATAIAAMAPLAALACKEKVNAAFETTLQQGVVFERRLFHGLFGTEDQKEGMAAFVEKRPGNWTGK